VRLSWLFLTLLIVPRYAVSQENDSAESSYSYMESIFTDQKDAQAAADSSQIIARNFDAKKLSDLKSDPDLKYTETPTVAESLWDRFLLLLQQFLDSLFRNAVTTDWGRLFSYLLGIAIIIGLVMMVLKVNAFKIFYGSKGTATPYHVLDENIHEMDFDLLIEEAIRGGDYRKGIRLLFLKGLKTLADKGLIHWEQGKTNHDYLAELSNEDLKAGFNELNYYFEYAWYGNFSITHDMFLKVQHSFTDWSRRIR
jgi:hypothetical protein